MVEEARLFPSTDHQSRVTLLNTAPGGYKCAL